jgi:hypothetical protein
MSNIEFEADVQNNPHYGAFNKAGMTPAGTRQIGMVKWLVGHGMLSSDSAAKGFLIGFVCVNFIATGLVLYFFVFR